MQNIVDLILVICKEIPINIATVFMKSTRVKEKVIASTTGICNLSGLAFLHRDGKKDKHIVSRYLKDCISDLAYSKLNYTLDGKMVDKCVNQAYIDFEFYTGIIVPLSTPKRVIKQVIVVLECR